MANQVKNRTVTPDGKTIQRLRIERGWRVEDLAKKAKCSLKTVENVERGANVYLYTLSKFAQALGAEVSTLMIGTEPPDPPKKERRFKVQFTLEIPFEEFDESKQLVSFLAMLKQILQAKDEITVASVEEGSTIITLEMSMDDIQRLLHEFTGSRAKAELDAFRVAWLKLPDAEDFTLTQTVENVEDGTISEEPLRGSVYRRGLPRPAPKPPAVRERPAVPDLPAVPEKPRHYPHDDLIEPPVPQHKPADPDADE
jgi:transcriptional regulator with XRE-family HTH domain